MKFNGIQSLMAMYNGSPVTCKYNGVDISTYIAPPVSGVIYGVKIDTLNTNPETALTYTDDAIGFTGALGNNGAFTYGSWADKFPFNQIKPVMLQNGQVNFDINPMNYKQRADGTAITGILDGDVMVQFPKIYWNFETVGTDLYIRISNVQVNSNYKCLAHMRGTTEKEFCYIAAFFGCNPSTSLRSFSGYGVRSGVARTNYRSMSQANGTGYDLMGYYQMTMVQVLFTIMFKNRNSLACFGKGYGQAGLTYPSAANKAYLKGMYYATTAGGYNNDKLFGLEDMLGNLNNTVDGIVITADRHILIGNENFNATGEGYTDFGVFSDTTDYVTGYAIDIRGDNDTAFMHKTIGSSYSLRWCDYNSIRVGYIPVYGNNYTSMGNMSGIYMSFMNTTSETIAVATNGGRLMYL